MSKLPEICELPPGISPCTTGAEYTTLSSTIAMRLFMFWPVIFFHFLAPSGFMRILTSGLPVIGSKSGRALEITSPLSSDAWLRPLRMAFSEIICLPVAASASPGLWSYMNTRLAGNTRRTSGRLSSSFTFTVSRTFTIRPDGLGVNRRVSTELSLGLAAFCAESPPVLPFANWSARLPAPALAVSVAAVLPGEANCASKLSFLVSFFFRLSCLTR